MRKRIILLLAILPFLSNCDSRDKWIGLFLYNQEDPFVYAFADQIMSEASSYDIPVEVFDSQNSQIIQNEYLENMIERNPDLLILNPVDRLGAYPIIRKLESEQIPVIFFNREPLAKDMALWDKAYYVGAKAEQSGQMQAKLIMDLFGGDPDQLNGYDLNGDNKIQAVILKGEQGHQDAEIRTSELILSFKKAGFDLTILSTEVANWSREESFDKTGPVLELYGKELEVILSNNDAMALGAIDRMSMEGLTRRIPVVGIDGLDEAVDEIQSGRLYGTVLNDSRTQAEAIVALSRFLLFAEEPDNPSFSLVDGKYIWIDYQTFTLK